MNLRSSRKPAFTARRSAEQAAGDIDVRTLERRLKAAVEGEVRFDAGSRALYATDASNFRQPPIGVVVPRTLDDVVATHRVCHEMGAPITSRGAGTSLSGETVNFAVIIDHSKYLNRILGIDERERWVHVENGAINEQVNLATGKHGFVFPPDPSTHRYCTIGGNIGNNSCGIHSVQGQLHGWGPRTSDNVHSLEIVTHDGVRMWVGETSEQEYERVVREGGRKARIYRDLRRLADEYGERIRQRFPSVEELPRRVSGYNLDELLPEKGFHLARALVGTEGTCVTVLTAKLLLTAQPNARALLLAGFDDLGAAADHVPRIMERKPIALEALDHQLFENEHILQLHPDSLTLLPDGRAWLMIELGGESQEDADRKARDMHAFLRSSCDAFRDAALFDDPEQEKRIWRIREAGLAATAFPPSGQDSWPGWEDSAVPPARVGDYVRALRRLYDRFGYDGAMYGHFGQGCIHSRIDFDLRSAGGVRKYREFLEAASDLVLGFGGSLSGEHGDGQQRAELLVKQFGEEIIDAMRQFKRIWDPRWKMNPGKVIDPYPLDRYLKLGTDYNPPRPRVEFAYTKDGGDFAHAMLRCVGVGRCRIPASDAVMCPSYMVTREEKHTTRGRARLLFEMLQGDVVRDGWRSKEVREALDLCLACKGCTNDCPVNVDMPVYKAEFLHKHYAGRLRPRHAYAFGLIDQAARAASLLPGVVNFLTQTAPFDAVAKLAAGMAPARRIPTFAPLSLQQWFRRRGGTRNPRGPAVLLWPDTFNNHFHTDVGVAAVQTLEAAGYRVEMPLGHVCCGRPLYDYGFLDLAKRYLRRTLAQLRPALRAGTPVVGLEPSCVATFKDELSKILPHDDDGRRLRRQVHHFGAFLVDNDVALPRLDRDAILWGHCHHKATGGIGPEKELLERLGLRTREVAGGCCGLAGSWGFERGHHRISMECGEQGLLPAVRNAPLDTLIVANGFSCKTQIEAGTDRRGLHVAQVIAMARDGTAVPARRPERAGCLRRPPAPRSLRGARAAAALGIGALAAAGVGWLARQTVR